MQWLKRYGSPIQLVGVHRIG